MFQTIKTNFNILKYSFSNYDFIYLREKSYPNLSGPMKKKYM